MFKDAVFSGPNAGKYGLEKFPYLDTFHAVIVNPFKPRTAAVHIEINHLFCREATLQANTWSKY